LSAIFGFSLVNVLIPVNWNFSVIRFTGYPCVPPCPSLTKMTKMSTKQQNNQEAQQLLLRHSERSDKLGMVRLVVLSTCTCTWVVLKYWFSQTDAARFLPHDAMHSVVRQKSQFLTYTLLYLGYDTRYGHS